MPLHLIEAIRKHVDEINTRGAEFIAGLKRGVPAVIVRDVVANRLVEMLTCTAPVYMVLKGGRHTRPTR